jgi:plasmid replication initiation protein
MFKAKNKQFERVFSLDEYKSFLGVEKDEYPAFENFRRRVIEPPVKEISDTTDLSIFEVRYIKTGRKITGIHFIVLIRSEAETSAQVAQLKIGSTPKAKSPIHPVVQTLIDRGIAFEVAQSLMKKHGVKRIERSLSYLLGKEASGVEIKDKIGYLMTAIRDDYGNAIEAQEQKKKDAIAKKKAEEEEKIRKAQEEAKRDEEKRQKTLKTIETFLTLPNGMKNLIKKGFLEVIQENPIKLERWNKVQKANDDSTIKDEPLIRGEFARYLLENNFIE